MSQLEKFARKSLLSAGIEINGNNQHDIVVSNPTLYQRVLSGGSLALGESYMDEWWGVKRLDEFFTKIFRSQLEDRFRFHWKKTTLFLAQTIFNGQNIGRSFDNIQSHYDIGNDLYEAMLDSRMVYTCGYWRNASNLEEAQEHKLDLVCRKIGLEEGMTVLDIGCGWSSFVKFATERYGAKVTGITISQNQFDYTKAQYPDLDVRLVDYRKIEGTYDRVVSLGMFEHVGPKNYRTYFEKVRSLLNPDGLFILQTIGGRRSVKLTDPWIGKYIFPNAILPSVRQIADAIEDVFVIEDWHSFGADYDKTLLAWFDNFNNSWEELKEKYSDRFYRMWEYYLLASAATFRSRKNHLWQIVLSPRGLINGYQSIR